jgi:taurine dioxygenase
MSERYEFTRPLRNAHFGGQLTMVSKGGAEHLVSVAEAEPQMLADALAESGGLLLLPGMEAMAVEPQLLLRTSRVFGPEVEDYRANLTPLNMVHPSVPQILVISNVPPANAPVPALPEPRLTPDGHLPVQFPHRRGWHTDQSYRRPPPDISLFLAVHPTPRGQGQTLFADGTAAYEALPPALKIRVDNLQGLHAFGQHGRTRAAVLAGEKPRDLKAHERSQRQPVVRTHPVTGRRALYLCEYGQMDWLDGPFVGMEPGPKGDGAELLQELMAHITQPEFVYVHEWTRGDLVVWDNRCLMHAGTWYDSTNEKRVMWRTTVSGNPGAIYAGEKKSWIPEEKGVEPMPAD